MLVLGYRVVSILRLVRVTSWLGSKIQNITKNIETRYIFIPKKVQDEHKEEEEDDKHESKEKDEEESSGNSYSPRKKHEEKNGHTSHEPREKHKEEGNDSNVNQKKNMKRITMAIWLNMKP